jgi:hypothetical protein
MLVTPRKTRPAVYFSGMAKPWQLVPEQRTAGRDASIFLNGF